MPSHPKRKAKTTFGTRQTGIEQREDDLSATAQAGFLTRRAPRSPVLEPGGFQLAVKRRQLATEAQQTVLGHQLREDTFRNDISAASVNNRNIIAVTQLAQNAEVADLRKFIDLERLDLQGRQQDFREESGALGAARADRSLDISEAGSLEQTLRRRVGDARSAFKDTAAITDRRRSLGIRERSQEFGEKRSERLDAIRADEAQARANRPTSSADAHKEAKNQAPLMQNLAETKFGVAPGTFENEIGSTALAGAFIASLAEQRLANPEALRDELIPMALEELGIPFTGGFGGAQPPAQPAQPNVESAEGADTKGGRKAAKEAKEATGFIEGDNLQKAIDRVRETNKAATDEEILAAMREKGLIE